MLPGQEAVNQNAEFIITELSCLSRVSLISLETQSLVVTLIVEQHDLTLCLRTVFSESVIGSYPLSTRVSVMVVISCLALSFLALFVLSVLSLVTPSCFMLS